ncbi:MAG TPA: serine/threonine-protein kinase [Spirochaetia bacterium]|nr:serine/threonine-protein kinase [Spirochaetia bacterium]
MNPGDLVCGRYEIARELGRGGAGATYLVRDARTGTDAVLKVLHFERLQDWKTVELFEREAAVLRSLHHPRIPAYVDSFHAEIDGATRYILVRQYVEGECLQTRVNDGWRATEDEIRALGARLLSIVEYIHTVRPPVIHRDINPRNIIIRPDGEVFVVDFGGVQDAIRIGSSGSTIIGTPGYTPLEQFVGRATVRSDLFAVAATLLFLLTHLNPADLPTTNMKIDFRSVQELSSPSLIRVLGNWLEPDEARRTLPVGEAIALLERDEPPGIDERDEKHLVPLRGSRISAKTRGGLRISIPERAGLNPRIAGFGMIWVGLVAFWTYASFAAGEAVAAVFFTLSLWGSVLWVSSRFIRKLFGRVEISIEGDELVFARRVLFLKWRRAVPLSQVGRVGVVTREEARRYNQRMGFFASRLRRGGLWMELGGRTVIFGQGLTSREMEWLQNAIRTEVRRARGEP